MDLTRRIITGRDAQLFEALKEAGIADENTRRVVIDIDVQDIVKVYVEKYTDSRIIDVVTTLTGIGIKSITASKCKNCGHQVSEHLPRCTDRMCPCDSYVSRDE